jgi:two-component system, cell cycle response regulator CpdR
MNRNSILVVDDEYDIVGIIKEVLEGENYPIIGFTEPLLALEHFKANYVSYILVVSDWRMPLMNGFDFAKSVRQIKSDIKVLIMTAFSIEDDSDFTTMLESQNIDGFIQKPFSIKNLKNTVKNHM